MDPVTIALTGLLAKKALEGPAARPGGCLGGARPHRRRGAAPLWRRHEMTETLDRLNAQPTSQGRTTVLA